MAGGICTRDRRDKIQHYVLLTLVQYAYYPLMFGKYVSRAAALIGVVGFLTISAPPAWADPDDPVPTTTDTLTLSLTDLGSDSTLTFYGLDGAVQVAVPVPRGLTPATLNATVQTPVNLRSGIISVTEGDRELAKVNLPADQAPIVIPLAGATVTDNTATVLLRAHLVPVEGSCFYSWSPLRLLNGTVGYTGVEQPPVTVAHFLPPVLRKLTIYVPQSPSSAESATAIQLVTSAAARYGKQNPQIVVVPLGEGQAAPPTPAQPQERQIVVKEGPDNGLSLQSGPGLPWLLMSGPLGATDKSDTALLFSDLSDLALAAKASVTELNPGIQLPGDNTTLRELGQPFADSTGLQPRVSIGLDQTRFGRSVHAVRVHLQGSYSPTPSNIGGQIVASIGPETIDQWPTDGRGTIDHWVDIPDRLLQRWTGLDLTLNVSGNVGRCGDFYTAGAGDQILKLTINGDSSVQSSSAKPPVPDGLRSVPQALMPKVQVGIGAKSFADTMRAAEIMVGLQRMSPIPIDATVTSEQQALDSPNPAIVIAAGGWNHPDVPLPVSAGTGGPVTVNAYEYDGKPAKLTLDPSLQFGSLQTVFNRGRSLLVATSNGRPAQLDELLRWLGSDSTRWQSVRGLALVSVPGQDPVIVDRPNTAGGAAAAEHQSASGSGLGWLWWIGGAWVAVAVIGAAVLVVRSRRESLRR